MDEEEASPGRMSYELVFDGLASALVYCTFIHPNNVKPSKGPFKFASMCKKMSIP